MKNAKVISIINQKGGVGKTTTAVNYGIGLARRGKKVLLIDADSQGSLTVSLGEQDLTNLDLTLASLMYGVIMNRPLDPHSAILHHREGVDFIPSNFELSGVSTALTSLSNREFILKSIVDSLRGEYDYILIDCLPSLGLVAINSLVAADGVIIPCHPAYLSTKGLNILLRTIAKTRRSLNPQLIIDGILLTCVDIHKAVHLTDEDQHAAVQDCGAVIVDVGAKRNAEIGDVARNLELLLGAIDAVRNVGNAGAGRHGEGPDLRAITQETNRVDAGSEEQNTAVHDEDLKQQPQPEGADQTGHAGQERGAVFTEGICHQEQHADGSQLDDVADVNIDPVIHALQRMNDGFLSRFVLHAQNRDARKNGDRDDLQHVGVREGLHDAAGKQTGKDGCR